MTHIRKNNGFTMVEVLVVAFLFGIILAATMVVLSTGRLSWNAGSSETDIQQECRKGMNAMVKELRQAGALTIPNVPPDNNNYTTITFQVPTAVSVTGATWSAAINYSLGGLNNQQLIRTQSGASTVLANNITTLTFRRSGVATDTVNISIAGSKNRFPGFTAAQSTAALVSRVQVRN